MDSMNNRPGDLKQRKRKIVRRALARLYGWRCHWCKCKLDATGHPRENPQFATIDHVVPLSKGGTSDMRNLKLACFACNSDRNTEAQLADLSDDDLI
jgi:5-methylcytosine-specific restriction endonuclease McrA